ncbi:sulfite exporter TauE/SafE family protein [Dechloromonas sp. XY25]|uniref:Probable membrane transporter protein n=1 Tax=Dechloromonas hankyongensis TaxID=2908002 RepID=A0ABS9JXJ8_9RHOO|nr:sulfite exporter TauE/SafE family protein [Dechloromonas hankyongensis]MCG2575631.1 sulfite exporter TauE/SafE family protein [Dechloromonas hankyongensis]
MTIWWLTYPLLGIFGGFVAGLFGVGGGLTLVPFLYMLFVAQGFPAEHVMHLALGTSMATIVFTSISSMRAHHAHGAVRWDIVRSMAPGLVLGTFGGSLVVGQVPTGPMTAIFVIIVYYASLQMMLDFKPKAHRQMPGDVGRFAVGGLIGVVSSLVAAGGGFLSVPFMLFCNVAIHQAVGTSSALGFPIAVAGAIGYIVAGWNDAGLPAHTFGYIYLPAFVGIVVMSITLAPVGAKLAHRLPVKKLKRMFGAFLAFLATKMLFSLLG